VTLSPVTCSSGVAGDPLGEVGAGIARVRAYTLGVLGEVLTATVTPFDANGNVDAEKYAELCAYLVDNGSDGVVVNGTTGEASTLSDDERVELIRAALDAIGDRATVIAGTGTNSTAHSIRLTEQAHEAGVHGVLVVTPYYNKPPPRGIVEHFKAVAATTDRPVIAYNIPGRVVINIEPETMTELAEIPNVKAVKQSNGDLDQASHIVELGLDLYAGDDNLVLPFAELGGMGGVCVHTHIVGPQVKELIRLAKEGDHEGARRIDEELAPAYELIGVVTGPIQMKAALDLLGHEVGGLRLPLVEASDDERTQIRACLERLKLLEPARV
jgi:4-hydroxy-tetrahydrodipicolinate synthase